MTNYPQINIVSLWFSNSADPGQIWLILAGFACSPALALTPA